MGLSIHYSGSISSKEMLIPLIEEVSDICKTLEWVTHCFDGKNDGHLTGISFSPAGSEPVFLTFLPTGFLCSPINLLCRDMYDGIKFEKKLMFTASTKTQYAGADAHISIIKLLKYISKKYLKDFNLNDEGDYWETGSDKILYAQFKRYNYLLNVVSDILDNLKTTPGEATISLADKIEKIIKEKFKGGTE